MTTTQDYVSSRTVEKNLYLFGEPALVPRVGWGGAGQVGQHCLHCQGLLHRRHWAQKVWVRPTFRSRSLVKVEALRNGSILY